MGQNGGVQVYQVILRDALGSLWDDCNINAPLLYLGDESSGLYVCSRFIQMALRFCSFDTFYLSFKNLMPLALSTKG